jgi:hypothetical protein
MNSNQSLDKIPSAAELAQRIRNVSNDLLGIAHDLVAALDAKPELAQELEDAGVNRELVSRLERLGRGQIHPRLVFSTTPGAEKLLTVPLSEQARVLDAGVEVMEDDETTTRNIPIHELSPEQARQVFHRGQVRSLAEQRTYLRARKKKRGVAAPTEDFRVCSDHVITSRPGKWPKKLILQWLMEMN